MMDKIIARLEHAPQACLLLILVLDQNQATIAHTTNTVIATRDTLLALAPDMVGAWVVVDAAAETVVLDAAMPFCFKYEDRVLVPDPATALSSWLVTWGKQSKWDKEHETANQRANQRISMRIGLEVLSSFDFIDFITTTSTIDSECERQRARKRQSVTKSSVIHIWKESDTYSHMYTDLVLVRVGRNADAVVDSRGDTCSSCTFRNHSISLQ